VLREGQLARVPVETGINDGTTTAVIGGPLQDGAHVVTAVAARAAAATAPPGTGSPLLPQRPNRARTQGRTR
jgi:hypothetical protein